ncbi:MAG TPA: VTT domain-containing protein, partial [Terriglobales bacterium]
MDHTSHFLLRHGYLLLSGWVFAEQMGVPLPALPLLLAAGAAAGRGELSFALLLALAVLAAALSDSLWYWIGKRRGGKVLSFLCRISLEPDSCVRDTQAMFTRRGPSSLLVAKFIPGLGTVSMPLAGIVAMPYPTFLAFELTGTLLWALTLLATGYIFTEQLDLILDYLHSGRLLLLA